MVVIELGMRGIVAGALLFAVGLQNGVLPAQAATRETRESAGKARCILHLGRQTIEFDPNDRTELEQAQKELEAVLDAREFVTAIRESPNNRARRGVHELRRLFKARLQASDLQRENSSEADMRETVAALNNLCRPPMPETLDFFQTPWVFLNRLSQRPVGIGHTAASNLQAGDNPDASQLDPEPSTFWRRASFIAEEDLYYGFGRTNLLLDTDPVCTYGGPKESFGRNPGFDVECQGKRLKLKFAEVSSEPFASRIFYALGYHVDPTDYAPRVKMRYSRRIFQEFNSRKPLKTHFTFLKVIPLFTLDLQKRYDPFDYLAAAVLTNGIRWSRRELKQHLFFNPSAAHPEDQSANFRPEIEGSVDYLITVPANVQQREGKSIGPWDFGDLDHTSRRELRGVALLAGWLGWFDTRFDNTRLKIVEHGGDRELEHCFSDLGGVLGETSGLLYARGEKPNVFPWRFTQPLRALSQAPGSGPFRLPGYKPIAPTPAFTAMTRDDAQWMGRLIGSLTEEQLRQALIASGFSSAQARLYLEKLVNRRDQMILDLGLASEISLLRRDRCNRHLNYDAMTDGALTIQVAGHAIQAPVSRERISNGKLLSRN